MAVLLRLALLNVPVERMIPLENGNPVVPELVNVAVDPTWLCTIMFDVDTPDPINALVRVGPLMVFVIVTCA